MKNKLLFLLFLFPFITSGQPKEIPSWFLDGFKKNKLDLKYSLSNFIKPQYLTADFNGDNIPDVAALVIEKKTNKKGILLMFGASNKHFVFGAGIDFGNSSDNFKWMDKWQVYKEKTAYETTFNKEGDITGSKTLKLKHPALATWQLEGGEENAGGIIYWTGSKFIWIQQGE